MNDDLSTVLQEAVEAKRRGDFELSLEYYLKAIDINPTYNMTYLGLGKTSYLANKKLFSILSYLSFLHLEMNSLEKQIVDDVLPMPYEEFYNDLPEHIKGKLPRKSGLLIFYNDNLIRHFAHTVLDGDTNRPKELDGLVEIYCAQIEGRNDYSHLYEKNKISPNEMLEIEENVYKPRGIQALLDYIKWDEVLSDDVISMYFDQDNPIV